MGNLAVVAQCADEDYGFFSIDSEDKKYRLHVSRYSGNAGDSLTDKAAEDYWYLDGANFSTPIAQNCI